MQLHECIRLLKLTKNIVNQCNSWLEVWRETGLEDKYGNFHDNEVIAKNIIRSLTKAHATDQGFSINPLTLGVKKRKPKTRRKKVKIRTKKPVQLKFTDKFIMSPAFIDTKEWKEVRNIVRGIYRAECCKCGYNENARHLNVDHIKPRKLRPDLALDINNLQILCGKCNKEKGNKNSIDYRKPRHLRDKGNYDKTQEDKKQEIIIETRIEEQLDREALKEMRKFL